MNKLLLTGIASLAGLAGLAGLTNLLLLFKLNRLGKATLTAEAAAEHLGRAAHRIDTVTKDGGSVFFTNAEVRTRQMPHLAKSSKDLVK